MVATSESTVGLTDLRLARLGSHPESFVIGADVGEANGRLVDPRG